MSATLTFMLMLLAHLVADYSLQGWLADGKQKRWWQKCFGGATPPKYSHDYLTALVCHALYWSLMVCAPLWWSSLLAPAVALNTAFHAWVDDLKANRLKINLTQDQLLHVLQIVVTFIVLWGAKSWKS